MKKTCLLAILGLAFASAAFAADPATPAACKAQETNSLASGDYVAPFHAVTWFDDEPYFKAGEYEGFSAIGNYNLDIPAGSGNGKGGLAVIHKVHPRPEKDLWRIEFYATHKGKCEWFGGTLLRAEHVSLLWHNALGKHPMEDPVIVGYIKEKQARDFKAQLDYKLPHYSAAN